MKQRNGFVSNSSSSSFVCDICGHDCSGWDISLTDAEMVNSNWGTYCQNELDGFLKEVGLKEEFDALVEQWESYYDNEEYEAGEGEEDKFKFTKEQIQEMGDYPYGLPDKYCPLFNLWHVMNKDLVGYLLLKSGQTKEQAIAQLKSEFKNLRDLREKTEVK